MKKNSSLKVIIEDYIPMLEEDDVTNLVDFVVELFNSEVQKDD